jgi:hypothetical protein
MMRRGVVLLVLSAAVVSTIMRASVAQEVPGGSTSPPALEQNTDRPGSDYSFFFVPNADPMACLNACTADKNCKSFSFIRPGVQGPEARCFLKHSVAPAVANACCVSGLPLHRTRPSKPPVGGRIGDAIGSRKQGQ